MEQNKHYIIVLDWASDDDANTCILGVRHSLEEALEVFKEHVEEEREFANDRNWCVETDTDLEFSAYEDGYYVSEHTRIHIVEC